MMRVPNISVYDNAKYNLGGLTGNLKDANEIMATQKRINSVSDDPIGQSQVLDLKMSIGNLDQIERNVSMGISWLKTSENALDSANNLILEMKTQVSRLINASMSADQREDAISNVNGMMEQLITLGNTKVNGNYIFSGTDTDILPFEYLGDEELPRVEYHGNNDPFEIKTDKEVTVPVGRDGKATFWDDSVTINSTNNTIVFKEDNGHGSASEIILEAEIQFGEYTPDELVKQIRNTLNEASSLEGYGVSYDVSYNQDEKTFSIREDGSYAGYVRTEFMWDTGGNAYITGINASGVIDPNDINLTVTNEQALTISTPKPHGTEPVRVVWQGDNTWKIENNPGYLIIGDTISGTRRHVGIDLDENGLSDIEIRLDTPVTAKGQYIEFEIVSAQGDHSIGHEIGFSTDDSTHEPPTSDDNAIFVTELTISDGVNDMIEFVEVNSTGGVSGTLTADLNTIGVDVTYTDMDNLASVIESQMEAVSANGINYAVTYDSEDSKFIIRENGSSLNELQILWSNSPAASATAETLGYYPLDDTVSYPVSDTSSQMQIVIDDTNNRLAFRETDTLNVSRTLWTTIDSGTYKTAADLENAIESAMNSASVAWGHNVTYDASYDDATHRFSFQRSGGTALNALDLLWRTSQTSESYIAETLGFNPTDDTGGGASGTIYR